MICPECDGEKIIYYICRLCDGNGCNACKGIGETRDYCPTCNGSGSVMDEEETEEEDE